MFHYWNGTDVEVIYFVLHKVIAKSDISHTWLPPEGSVITWCTELVTAANTGMLGACQKNDVNFRRVFEPPSKDR